MSKSSRPAFQKNIESVLTPDTICTEKKTVVTSTTNTKIKSILSNYNEKFIPTISAQKIIESFDDRFIYHPVTGEKGAIVSKWQNLKKTPIDRFKDGLNCAIITGRTNNIVLIDIDLPKPHKIEKHGLEKYEELLNIYNNGEPLITPTCITQSGGLHLYFQYDKDLKTSTGINGYSVDIRNDGGYTVCPPSVGPCGLYTWLNNMNLSNTELAIIPKWLKNWILLNNKTKIKTKPNTKRKISTIPLKVLAKRRPVHKTNNCEFIYKESDIIDLLSALPKKYVDSYVEWFTITSCLKSE